LAECHYGTLCAGYYIHLLAGRINAWRTNFDTLNYSHFHDRVASCANSLGMFVSRFKVAGSILSRKIYASQLAVISHISHVER